MNGINRVPGYEFSTRQQILVKKRTKKIVRVFIARTMKRIIEIIRDHPTVFPKHSDILDYYFRF